MSVIESIVQGVQRLSLREQVEIAEHVYRLDAEARQRCAEMLKRTHGALNEEDGEAFEEALKHSRRI